MTLNPVEPPWYVNRMPGGVGGAAPRGAPLSRSMAKNAGMRVAPEWSVIPPTPVLLASYVRFMRFYVGFFR